MKTSTVLTLLALSGALATAHAAPTVITTAQGKGADASLRGGDYATRPFGELDILRVRNATDLRDARKTYVRFDLATLQNAKTATGAVLNLTVAPAEGASPADKTWTFKVYGLKDGAGETWDEKTINWTNAPLSVANSSFEMKDDATLLGTFTLKGRGTAGETVSFTSPELLKMAKDDGNGEVTLVISRVERNENNADNVVHIFAAKEHATLAPPSLSVAFNGENSVVAVATQTVTNPAAAQPAVQPSAPKPFPYESTIAAWEKSDTTKAPAKGSVVFIGSSSIGRWKTLKQDFPGVNVIQRGFGGSDIIDSVHFAQRIVTPYEPKMVFFYAGSNDISKGKSPEVVLADYQAFVSQVREKMPTVPIAFISIAPSPSRWSQVEKVKKANGLIEQFSGLVPGLKFVDIFPLMLDANGQIRPELYVSDGLHMSPLGYEIWVKAVKTILHKP